MDKQDPLHKHRKLGKRRQKYESIFLILKVSKTVYVVQFYSNEIDKS